MMERMANWFTSRYHQPRATVWLFRMLVSYHLVKVILTWPVTLTITSYGTFARPKAIISWILFGPSIWGVDHIAPFTIFFTLVLIVALFTRVNYFLSVLVFWLALNYYRINFSVANGSDLVLVEMLFFTIFFSSRQRGARPGELPVQGASGIQNGLAVVKAALHNGALLLCQIHIAMLYLVSGVDKITNVAWRSGDAIGYVTHLDFMINPGTYLYLPDAGWILQALSWMTIVFELSFPLLIWFSKTRMPVLIAGVLFHMVIWVFLSLPDFGLLMMLTYMIYLRDSDYAALRKMYRRLVPVKPVRQ